MLEICKILIFVHCLHSVIQCLIPDLSVRKVDKRLIQRKRQDTLEMCRIFNAENSKINNIIKSGTPKKYINKQGKNRHRTKRDIPSGNMKAVFRAESFVDDIYGDMMDNGQPVEYRRRDVGDLLQTTPKIMVMENKTNRRFNFAPALLTGPESPQIPDHRPNDDDTVKHPWPKKWKHGIIPYFIDSKSYDSELIELIMSAFDYFEKATCIRLQRLRERPLDKVSMTKIEWLYITNPSGIKQCVHSNERKENHGVQMVVFGYDCLSRGEIVHEIMHVLGFSHEHIRPDRDHHITILWDNIKPGYKKYFEIHPENTLTSIPYDYSSILHYPSRAFSKNGQVTLLAENGAKLGQREGLSETDIEKINLIFGSDCVDRNRDYLLNTCPTVVKAAKTVTQNATRQAITEYFKDRLWPFGIVNYKIRDRLEFTSEEIENIRAVMEHIERETCITFRDLSEPKKELSEDEGVQVDNNYEVNQHLDTSPNEISVDEKSNNEVDASNVKQNDTKNELNPDITKSKIHTLELHNYRKNTGVVSGPDRIKRFRRKAVIIPSLFPKNIPSRRHADNILILTRSPNLTCQCPPPGKPSGDKVLEIGTDCFNSVNDLLHLFVHLLGLDHQHNMHDRDSYIRIVWDNVSPGDQKNEMAKILPPAASVGFPYDYQSVMHYPWLQIHDGTTNLIYPIWNDGWIMGHWQGLSSSDVQKLNLLYFEECQSRKKEMAENVKFS